MWVGGGWGGGRGCRKVAEFDFVETHGQLAMTYRGAHSGQTTMAHY